MANTKVTIKEYIESPNTPLVVSKLLKAWVDENRVDDSCDVYATTMYQFPSATNIPIVFEISDEPSACVWCGHQPRLKAHLPWSDIRYAYKCSNCAHGNGNGTELSNNAAHARIVWNRVNHININKLFNGLSFLLIDGAKICSGDLMSKLYSLWRYEKVEYIGLKSVIYALLNSNAVDDKFACELIHMIDQCVFDSDWTPFEELYDRLTPMG